MARGDRPPGAFGRSSSREEGAVGGGSLEPRSAALLREYERVILEEAGAADSAAGSVDQGCLCTWFRLRERRRSFSDSRRTDGPPPPRPPVLRLSLDCERPAGCLLRRGEPDRELGREPPGPPEPDELARWRRAPNRWAGPLRFGLVPLVRPGTAFWPGRVPPAPPFTAGRSLGPNGGEDAEAAPKPKTRTLEATVVGAVVTGGLGFLSQRCVVDGDGCCCAGGSWSCWHGVTTSLWATAPIFLPGTPALLTPTFPLLVQLMERGAGMPSKPLFLTRPPVTAVETVFGGWWFDPLVRGAERSTPPIGVPPEAVAVGTL